MSRKILVFFPDGVGLRNFAFTRFKDIGEQRGNQIIYWNNTVFPLNEELGYEEVLIDTQKIHPLTPYYCRVRKHIELNVWARKFKDSVYHTYKFPFNSNGVKNALMTFFVRLLIAFNSTEKGILRIRKRINSLERSTQKYHYCKKQLQEIKPDLVFCTTQRATQSIGALLAAKDLGIPSLCFVYSWDNVPKAMQLVETDFYCVWSKLMKEQMLQYYPFIKENQLIVTGTPQFEPHYDASLLQSRKEFCEEHQLEQDRKYICFSGDDQTTSPLDQYYLEDLAQAVRILNKRGYKLGIIYRKCPVDTTSRYEDVINANKELISVIDPLWEMRGNQWNEVFPLKADLKLLHNVCAHSEFVANICSSTVFDFVAHQKACIYFNYEQPQLKKGIRDIGQNYKYVHFRSMPSQEAVIFCTDKRQLASQIESIINGNLSNVSQGSKWYAVVAGERPFEASERIWNSIDTILR